MKKIPLLVIVGPTASGKTALSVELAKRLNGEIVSADSMQIYKNMDIATAKPTDDEKQGIVHHLMDFLPQSEKFSVADYCVLAKSAINDISSKNKLPILVGGTGLYIDSLVDNVDFSPVPEDENLREQLYTLAEEKGADYLLDILSEFDEESAVRLSEQKNIKRIVRSIEVYKLSGITQTQHNLNSKLKESPYKTLKIGLKAQDRQFLYDRINKRVDEMKEKGLVDEAKDFFSKTNSNTASMAIGYKELLPYFEGEKSLDDCIDTLKMQTRRYAKRQLTWFSKDESIIWFSIDEMDFSEIINEAEELVKKELFNE